MRLVITLFLAIGILLAVVAGKTDAIETTFETDLEGWYVTGDNDSRWQAGTLYVDDLATGNSNFIVAPLPWLGDWSGATVADTLGADYFFVNTSGGALTSSSWYFELSGPGGRARAIGPEVLPQGVWTRIEVSLDPSDWTLLDGTWQGLLADVQVFLLDGEFVTGEENVFVDNIRLSRTPGSIPFPCVSSTFDSDILFDMTLENTGGITLPATGGNLGAFCQIADGTGTSYAFAPPRFLGDWTSFEGAGSIGIDIRILGFSGSTTGVTDFIRISGPGGSAQVSLAAADIPAGPLVWKRRTFPIEAAGWTVTSGNWAALLANVTECRITVEFYSGTETIGIDNLVRGGIRCGDPDNPVQSTVPDVPLCGYESLLGISSLAIHPADGALYGLIDQVSSSGGGLYRADGPAIGTLLQAYTQPADLIGDAAGNIYVSESVSGNIYRRTPGGSSSIWVAGFHAGDDDPFGMCVAPAGFVGPNVAPGDLLVTDRGFNGPDELWAFSTAAAENERLVMPDTGETDYLDLAAAPAGIVFMVDALDATRITRLMPDGTFGYLALTSPIPGMVGIVHDDLDNQLYVISGSGLSLHRVHPTSGAATMVSTGFSQLAPCGIAIDTANRKLHVADKGAGRIYTFCLLSGSGVADGPGPATPDSGRRLSAPLASPNPSAGHTIIQLTLAVGAMIDVTIFDINGRLVATPWSGTLDEGSHRLDWDGRDDSGRALADGVYFIRASTADDQATGRLLRIGSK